MLQAYIFEAFQLYYYGNTIVNTVGIRHTKVSERFYWGVVQW